MKTKNSSYAEKLKDPRWQKIRLQVLERDNFCCRACRDTETTLHVHHLKYCKTGNPWDVAADDLITLCAHCHFAIENQVSLKTEAGKCLYHKTKSNDLCQLRVYHPAYKRSFFAEFLKDQVVRFYEFDFEDLAEHQKILSTMMKFINQDLEALQKENQQLKTQLEYGTTKN